MVRMKKVASRVRKAYEDISSMNGGSGDLAGYCCRASGQLFLAAQRHGIKGVKLVLGNGHVFVVYKGYIVDVTATQFGVSDPVYITPYVHKDRNNAWCTRQGPFNSIDEFERETGWSVHLDDDISVVLRYDDINDPRYDMEHDPFEEHPYVY